MSLCSSQKKDGDTEEAPDGPFLPINNPRANLQKPFLTAMECLGMQEKEWMKLTMASAGGGKKSVSERDYGIDPNRGPNEAQFIAFCKGAFDGGQHREVVIKFMSEKEQFKNENKVREDLSKEATEVRNWGREYLHKNKPCTYIHTILNANATLRLPPLLSPAALCQVYCPALPDLRLDGHERSEHCLYEGSFR